jgi:peptide/nickel transport system substrate-binding protein
MKKRNFLALILVFSMLLSLAACGQTQTSETDPMDGSASTSVEEIEEPPAEEEEEEQLPFALGYYRGVGINPYTCDSVQNQTLVGLVYEPLFEVDDSFQVIPCLAESVTASLEKSTYTVDSTEDEDEEDGDESGDESKEEDKDKKESKKSKTQTVNGYVTNVTIKLRKDVTFSDGSKMDAGDVTYSLGLAQDKDSIYYSRLSQVTSVTYGGSDTVYLTIQGANTNVGAILDIPIVKEGTGGDLFPVGTGAYTVKRDKKGLPKRLIANSSWWQLGREYEEEVLDQNATADSSETTKIVTRTIKQPLDTIEIYVAEDNDELIFGFSSGGISMVSTDLTGVDSLQFTGQYTVTDYATTNMLYLGCNTDKGACTDQELRAAIYRSLDRDLLATRLMAGHAAAASMPMSPSSPLYDEELARELEYSLDTAKELYKGVSNSSTLQLIVNSDSTFKVAMAQEIKKELEAAGWSVEVESLEWKDFRSALKKGNYDLYLGEVKLNGNFDMSRFVNTSGSLNYSGYDNNNLRKASRAFNTADSGERAEKATAFYTMLAEQAPIIPICFKEYSVLSRDGYLLRQTPTQSNLFYHFWDWSFTLDATELANTDN